MVQKYKCVVVGHSAVGKTSLIATLAKGAFLIANIPPTFETTIQTLKVDGTDIHLEVVDTVGKGNYDGNRDLAYSNANVVLICFSIASPNSLRIVQDKWMAEVLQHCSTDVPIVLVGCQKDLRYDSISISKLDKLGKKPTMPGEGEDMARLIGAVRYVECSAIRNEGVREVFEVVAREVVAVGGGKRGRVGCCVIL